MESESLARTYIIEIKRVSLYCRSQSDKKRGPQNEGKSHDVIENKVRKNGTFQVFHDVTEKKQVNG
jgi:hypothetical protein